MQGGRSWNEWRFHNFIRVTTLWSLSDSCFSAPVAPVAPVWGCGIESFGVVSSRGANDWAPSCSHFRSNLVFLRLLRLLYAPGSQIHLIFLLLFHGEESIPRSVLRPPVTPCRCKVSRTLHLNSLYYPWPLYSPSPLPREVNWSRWPTSRLKASSRHMIRIKTSLWWTKSFFILGEVFLCV